jgi:hypothetical protein
VDTVLGVSVTPTNVRSVLVDGASADGATLGHDQYDDFEEVGAALRRTRDAAEAAGRSVGSIGVTWSDDAELQTSVVLESMGRAGLTDVNAVPLSEAVEALARSIGRVTGHQRTALCVVEPGTAALAVVDADQDSVDVLVSHEVDADSVLIDWVTSSLGADDPQGPWRPDALFVVGSVAGLDGVANRVEAELALPVFNPPEAELALAHGAALAAADSFQFVPFDLDLPVSARSRRNPAVGPMTLLVAGAVTFVVSLSIAVGDQLLPTTNAVSAESRPVDKTAGSPPLARTVPPAPAAPAPEPPPVVVPVLVDEALPPAPPVEALPPEPVPEYVPEYVPEPAPVAPPAPVFAPPPPPVYQAPVYQAPVRQPGLWERFKEKLKPGPDRPAMQLAPGAVPPPGVVVLPPG